MPRSSVVSKVFDFQFSIFGNFGISGNLDSFSILHADQKQPAGGGGGCGGGAVTQFKNALDVCDREAAFADHEKCSNEVAHHVMKKAVAADGVDQFVGVALPLGEKDGSDVVGFEVGFIGLEARFIGFKSSVVQFKSCFVGLRSRVVQI